jgi:hypothetical protein
VYQSALAPVAAVSSWWQRKPMGSGMCMVLSSLLWQHLLWLCSAQHLGQSTVHRKINRMYSNALPDLFAGLCATTTTIALELYS